MKLCTRNFVLTLTWECSHLSSNYFRIGNGFFSQIIFELAAGISWIVSFPEKRESIAFIEVFRDLGTLSDIYQYEDKRYVRMPELTEGEGEVM